MTCMCYNPLIWWGEIWCLSLLGLKGLIGTNFDNVNSYFCSFLMWVIWLRRYREHQRVFHKDCHLEFCPKNKWTKTNKNQLWWNILSCVYYILQLYLLRDRLFDLDDDRDLRRLSLYLSLQTTNTKYDQIPEQECRQLMVNISNNYCLTN